MKNKIFCDIYVASVCDVGDLAEIYPKTRREEIEGVKNERVRREKYSVWRLLGYALKNSLGIDIKEIDIKKNENGKWLAEDVYFSLSHAKNAVAVAVSSAPVGIDIEPLTALKNDISGRVLTESEIVKYVRLGDVDKREDLIKKWTAKEAIFKSRDEAIFRPEGLEVSEYNVEWLVADVCEEKYVVAVSGEQIEKINVFEKTKI